MTGDAGQGSDIDEAILEAAARWHGRARAGLSEAERKALLHWLRERPEHAAAADIVARTWDAAPAAAHRGGFTAAAAARHRPARVLEAQRPRKLAWAGLATAAAAASVTFLVWSAQPQTVAIATGPQERRSAALSDRSRVWLAPGTRLAARISPFGRHVTIEQGEAAFDVVHQLRGFRVEAGDVAVVDRGTLFTVRHRAGRPVRVTLAEGALTVNDRASDAILAEPQPGQQVEVTDSGAQLRTVDAEDALAWREGRLIFTDCTLEEALSAFEDQGSAPIRLQDRGLAALRVSGAYSAEDVESFLTALSSIHPVRWTRAGAGYAIGRR